MIVSLASFNAMDSFEAKSKEEALTLIREEGGKKWSEKLSQEFIGIVKSDMD